MRRIGNPGCNHLPPIDFKEPVPIVETSVLEHRGKNDRKVTLSIKTFHMIAVNETLP